MRKQTILLIASLLIGQFINAQSALGEWQEHLPYYLGQHIAEGNEKVYCSTDMGLFYYSNADASNDKITKIDGLSDVGVNTIEFNKETNLLLVAYSNSNIDMIRGNSIYNIPDIKNKIMSGNKSINNILFINKTAYLACGFGIVLVDLDKLEIKDTYYIGEAGSSMNIYDLTFDGISIYAATEYGIYYADINGPTLANYASWLHLDSAPHNLEKYTSITVFNNKIYSIFENETEEGYDTLFVFDYNNWSVFDTDYTEDYTSVKANYDKLLVIRPSGVRFYDEQLTELHWMHQYPWGRGTFNHAIQDVQGTYWYADNGYGLVRSLFEFSATSIAPNGPYRNSVVDIEMQNGNLYAAGGGRTPAWDNAFSVSGVYTYKEGWWENLNRELSPSFPSKMWDINEIAIDPRNSNHFFAGAWGWGLLEFLNNELIEIHNDSNSSLQTIFSGPYCRIGGTTYDNYNNLWVSNAGVDNVLSVYTNDNEWFGFPYGSTAHSGQVGNIAITQNNDKWLILPKGEGLFVFNEYGTYDDLSDDSKLKLSIKDEDGEVINDVYSLAVDEDDIVWVGTNQGVLAYYNPQSVFQTNLVAHRVVVELDGVPQHLLGTETVTSITIDGANRKWFGTRSAGAFLMSEDATELIQHFNTANSPLLSNYITDIAIDNESGEIFFGTDKGISSYRGTATEGKNNFEGLYVFPNPVRPGYEGDIVIKGTTYEASVKITDIAGNLVYETKSLGGQAIWDGKNFSGEKVHTGVYLVFCTNDDGSETEVTKLLFVR